MMDPEGRYLDANPAFCAITGYSVEELHSYAFSRLIHPDDRAANVELVEKMLAGEIADHVTENRYVRKGRESIWVRKSGSMVRAADGAPRWLIVLVEDVTARVQAEEALRESDRRKDAFIATLAHELRNPLTPIYNAAHILKHRHGPQSGDAVLLDMIQRQTGHLVRLVDDLLEIARINSGKIELRRESVDMGAVLRDALETCGPLIDSKGHRLEITVPDETITVNGDPVRLVQIALNLINNAAKYTPTNGNVSISLAREGVEAVFRVRDDGVGIDPELIPRVFDVFAQSPHHGSMSEGGLGIGLAVVSKLVALHGGSVEGRSEGRGKGCEFVVRLPIEGVLAP